MKHIRLFEELINEIGDASAKPYKWKKDHGTTPQKFKRKQEYYKFLEDVFDTNMFEFTTDKGTLYVVEIDIESVFNPETQKFDLGAIDCEIDFSTKNKMGTVSMDSTNMHEQYAVMSTITDILVTWINKWDKELYINKITVDPIKDDDGDGVFRAQNKRGRLYHAYMKKQISKLNKQYHIRAFDDHFEISPKFTNPKDPSYQ